MPCIFQQVVTPRAMHAAAEEQQKDNPAPWKCLHITPRSQAEHWPRKTSQWYNLLFFPDHKDYVSVSIKCDQLHNQVQVVSFTVGDNYVYLQQETISVCMWIAVDVSLTRFCTENLLIKKTLKPCFLYRKYADQKKKPLNTVQLAVFYSFQLPITMLHCELKSN